MKVCIPSKNRASTIKTHLFFKPEDVLIFVEPQEAKRYQVYWPEYKIIDIQNSNKGIAYVRNFIIDNSNEDKIIMADDDVTYLGVRTKDNRYDDLIFDSSNFLKDVEKGLDTYCGYSIPKDTFAYFNNKNSNQQRFYINIRYLTTFFGLNLKKMKENNIRYDSSIFDTDDVDITAQLLLNNHNVCIDYLYALKNEVRAAGGLTDLRKMNGVNVDEWYRTRSDILAKKYGLEFLRMSRDEEGYLTSYHLDLQLLIKRKEIAKRKMEKYYSEIRTK